MGKVQCEKCHKKCRGDVFKVGDNYYHKDCFKCKICSLQLDSGGFFMRDNSFYCQKDYALYFSMKCKACKEDLDKEVVSALNASFHRGCFKCATCQKTFNPGDHVSVISDHYYCISCAKQSSSENKKKPQQQQQQHADKSKTSSFFRRLLRSSSMDPRSQMEKSRTAEPYHHPKETLTIDANLHHSSDQENVSPNNTFHVDNLSKTLDSSSLHLYQSYLHLNECRVRNPHDLYKRIPSLGTLPSESAYRPRQFHIPETRRNRYSSSFGPERRFTSLRTCVMPPSENGHRSRASTLGLSYRPLKMHGLSVSTMMPSNGSKQSEETPQTASPTLADLTEEVRRLALFPDGHCRPENIPAPIERLDWPAPASTGVVMAELMRERRRRKQASLKSSVSGGDLMMSSDADLESHEALSIDASLNSSMAAVNEPHSHHMSRSTTKSRPAKCKSVNLDLISASRSPSANVEPPYRTRFANHHFASPSRDTTLLRDSLHSGSDRLTYSLDYMSPTRSATLLTNGSFAYFEQPRPMGFAHSLLRDSRNYQSARFPGCGGTATTSGTLKSSTEEMSLGGGHQQQGFHHSDDGGTLKRDSGATLLAENGLVGSAPSMPSVLYASTPSAAFYRRQPAPPSRVFPYEALRLTNDRIPAGLDRLHLENHLSDAEFELVFRMRRPEFYLLPEWKRNDMKRRMHLF